MADEASVWHGYAFADAGWEAPKCLTKSTELARPKYSDVDASEYGDSREVLNAKVDALCSRIKASKAMSIYTGAGLSTAAGIGDYASKASGSLVAKEGSGSRLDLKPTRAHRVLAALEETGHLKHWVNQNHDGLAQKAGYPYNKLNEIHGGWFDRNNPVVLMDGVLKDDLLEWLLQWGACTDLVIAMGTSLCGMNADRYFSGCCERHRTKGQGLGGVIINLQRTPHDGNAALRIYAKIDTVFELIAKKMKLKLSTTLHSAYPPVDRKAKRKVLPPEDLMEAAGIMKVGSK